MSTDQPATPARQQKKKLKVYQEEAKLRQTTHWDLDYMTTAEIDALYRYAAAQRAGEKTDKQRTNVRRQGKGRYKKIGLAFAALTLAGVVVLSLWVVSGGM